MVQAYIKYIHEIKTYNMRAALRKAINGLEENTEMGAEKAW